jgi:hypothetical protein
VNLKGATGTGSGKSEQETSADYSFFQAQSLQTDDKKTKGQNSRKMTPQNVCPFRNAAIRLLGIPAVVYSAWLGETLLLFWIAHVPDRPDPPGILPFTVVVCIITGILVPVYCIKNSFVTGTVNMFQIGFRSVRRTFVMVFLTAVMGYAAVVLVRPFGDNRFAFINAFLLVLPMAIASVMICWALAGTHVQAYVRERGIKVSIILGVAATAVLFGIALPVYSGTIGSTVPVSQSVVIGIVAALFFFSVRDVYATAVIVAVCTVFAVTGSLDPVYLYRASGAISISAVLCVASLAAVHLYFSRNFRTILIQQERT